LHTLIRGKRRSSCAINPSTGLLLKIYQIKGVFTSSLKDREILWVVWQEESCVVLYNQNSFFHLVRYLIIFIVKYWWKEGVLLHCIILSFSKWFFSEVWTLPSRYVTSTIIVFAPTLFGNYIILYMQAHSKHNVVPLCIEVKQHWLLYAKDWEL
jgi:hypothetical protein